MSAFEAELQRQRQEAANLCPEMLSPFYSVQDFELHFFIFFAEKCYTNKVWLIDLYNDVRGTERSGCLEDEIGEVRQWGQREVL